MNRDEAVAAVHDANNDRAMMYLAMYRELLSRHGKQEAIDTLRAAFFQHGRGFGETLKSFAPGDFDGLYDAFAKSPDGGEMFSPQRESCDEKCMKIKFMTCPLQKAWRNASVSDDELQPFFIAPPRWMKGPWMRLGLIWTSKLGSPAKLDAASFR